MTRFNWRKLAPAAWLALGLAIIMALCACAHVSLPPFGGRICQTDFPSGKDCACYVYVLGSGWHFRDCPTPSPSPSQTPTPQPTATPTPVPTPTPTPVPTPQPTPTPCVPSVQPFKCPSGTPAALDCWQCSDRIAWEIERGNWTPLPGSGLLYNDPGNNPQRREYLDRACNLVTRDGSIIRNASHQFGLACVESNAVCPPSEVVPCPSPLPTPTPGPTPDPEETPIPCDQIALCGIGAQVHQFQNRFAQTVPYTREGEGSNIYVPNGPVVGGKVQTDQTPYYKPKVNPPGGCGPAFACNGEGGYWHGRCTQCEQPGVWSQVSGPHVEWHLYNNGFGVEAEAIPGEFRFKVCGSNQGQPNNCREIGWRITQ